MHRVKSKENHRHTEAQISSLFEDLDLSFLAISADRKQWDSEEPLGHQSTRSCVMPLLGNHFASDLFLKLWYHYFTVDQWPLSQQHDGLSDTTHQGFSTKRSMLTKLNRHMSKLGKIILFHIRIKLFLWYLHYNMISLLWYQCLQAVLLIYWISF